MGGAIGKNGNNVNKLKKMLNKNIELLPYTIDPTKFVSTVFDGIKFSEIKMQEEEGKKFLFAKTDAENKRKLLQSMGKMKRVKEVAKRNYEIEDIRIK
jgi:N utilization substance protein A